MSVPPALAGDSLHVESEASREAHFVSLKEFAVDDYAIEVSPIYGGRPADEAQVAPILIWLGAQAIRMSAHAIAKASARGISQHMIRQVILNGKRTHGNNNTWIYTSGNIRVFVGKSTGNVVTVTWR